MTRLALLGTALFLALLIGVAGPAVTITPDSTDLAIDLAPVVSAQPDDDDDDDNDNVRPAAGAGAAAGRAGGFSPLAVAGASSLLGLTTLGAGLVIRRRRRK